MTFYMQYHLHCHFHSYYSQNISFRIKQFVFCFIHITVI